MINNKFILESEAAREYLLAQTRMSLLDYDLLILESGCQMLDEICRPTDLMDADACKAWREELVKLGYWDWYAHSFMSMEINVSKAWQTTEYVVAMQPPAYKRERLITEAAAVRADRRFIYSFECWLKLVHEERYKSHK